MKSNPTMVLSDVFPPQHGGSGRWMWDLYRRQKTDQYIMVVGDSHGDHPGDQEYPQKIIRAKLDMPYRGVAKISSIAHYTRQFLSIRRIAKTTRTSTIHAARPLSEGLIAAAIKKTSGIPYLCYVHGEDINIAKTSRELTLVTNHVLNSAHAIIANSHFSKQLLTNEWNVPDEKVNVLHPGIDTSRFDPSSHENANAQTLRLLTVGRLQARKGQDTVIQALPKLAAQFPNVSYTIAGDGEDKKRLQTLAANLGVTHRVNFFGAFDDSQLSELYASHDVFVLANRTIGRDVEGFGIVLLEAQASGLPVIAGDSGGTTDTLLDGVTGFISQCETPDHLISILCDQIPNGQQRSQMGSRGAEHVRRKFDWDILAKQAESFFHNAGNPHANR